jgi:hypothetical protein
MPDSVLEVWLSGVTFPFEDDQLAALQHVDFPALPNLHTIKCWGEGALPYFIHQAWIKTPPGNLKVIDTMQSVLRLNTWESQGDYFHGVTTLKVHSSPFYDGHPDEGAIGHLFPGLCTLMIDKGVTRGFLDDMLSHQNCKISTIQVERGGVTIDNAFISSCCDKSTEVLMFDDAKQIQYLAMRMRL